MVGEKTREFIRAELEKQFEKVTNVLGVFEDFFGEDKVDLQGIPTVSKIEEVFLGLYGEKSIGSLGELSHIEAGMHNTELVKDVPDEILSSTSSVMVAISEVLYHVVHESSIKIIVYFPEVRVSNEYNKFIDITELYTKISLDLQGTMVGSFSFNRGEYTMEQYLSDYMHSHVCGIPKNNPKRFFEVCLGSGPIRNTVNNLNANYDLDIWRLFCVELDKYVATESISGGPYRRLENVSSRGTRIIASLSINNPTGTPQNLVPMINEFIKYFIKQKKLVFNYRNGSYSIGMNLTKFILLVSNEFITWFNTNGRYKYAKSEIERNYASMRNIITTVFVTNNAIYKTGEIPDRLIDNRSNLGVMGTFKGKEIVVHIAEWDNSSNNLTTILVPEVIGYILGKILKVINCEYGKNRPSSRNEQEQNGETENSSNQECYYL